MRIISDFKPLLRTRLIPEFHQPEKVLRQNARISFLFWPLQRAERELEEGKAAALESKPLASALSFEGEPPSARRRRCLEFPRAEKTKAPV